MAYKLVKSGIGGRGKFTFYLNDRAVGPGRPNLREDVFLVQYFLKKLSFYQVMAAPGNLQKQMQVATFAVDGLAGPVTFQWIRDFQKAAQLKLGAWSTGSWTPSLRRRFRRGTRS